MPHTLLLADDSVTIQRVIELTFADEDVKVVAVSDGDEAIARIEQSPPDIVLADIGMPGKTGYEVAQFIKHTPRLAHIPVVLLTGAFEPVDQARAAEAGCDGVLAKPFEPQLVIGRVKELLANASRPEQRAGAAAAPAAAPAQERWSPPLMDQPFASAPAATPNPSAPSLDDYFNRLDAAFANLSGGASASPAATTEHGEPPLDVHAALEAAAATPSPIPTEIDWFGTTTSPAPPADSWDVPAPATESGTPDLPLSYASPQEAFTAEPVPSDDLTQPEGSLNGVATHAESSGAAPTHAEAMPQAAADAETLIVPAPEAAPAVAAPPAPPAPAPLPSLGDAFAALLAAEQNERASSTSAWPATLPSTDDLIEQVTRLVLERLSDRVMRDTVADLVSQTAERLVREEIERIKGAIK